MAKFAGNNDAVQYQVSPKVVKSWPKGWRTLLKKGWGEDGDYDPKAKGNGKRPRRKPDPKK